MSTLRTLSRQEDAKYLAADRSSDRVKRATATVHRQKRDRCNLYVQKLAKEFKEQTAARAFTMKRLAREKSHWFAHSKFLSFSMLYFILTVYFRLESHGPHRWANRTLFPAKMSVVSYGCRLLRAVCPCHAPAGNTGFLDSYML